MLKLELDRYIGQPIYIGRYQYQADISYRLSTTDKYRLTIACFIRATVQLLLKCFVFQSKHELVGAFYLLCVYSPHMQINNAHARPHMYHAFLPLFSHVYVRAQLAEEKSPTSMQTTRGNSV